MTKPPAKICLFTPSYGDGGVERMLVNLATGFSRQGVSVDFITKAMNAAYINNLDEKVNLVTLGELERKNYVDFLLDYFRTARPDIILSSKQEDDRVVREAKLKTDMPVRFFIRCPTAILSRMQLRRHNPIKKWMKTQDFRKSFAQTSGIIAVSSCVADEVSAITNIARDTIVSIANPVVTDNLESLADAQIAHPWFKTGTPRLILGAGGLRKQKDFSTLIKAFAIVRQQLDCRLLILGDGRQKNRLQKLVNRLGINTDVDLHRFVENPYPYMAQADLFVMSSLWEGSGNVLTEALALGTAVVSTDCRCGPAETLQQGKYGELVPINNPQKLAAAMINTLKNPLPAEVLRQAAKDYQLETSAKAYLQAFGLTAS